MEKISILPIIITFLISIILTFILLKLFPKYSKFGIDQDYGVQKIHQKKAIRLGSLPIFITSLIIYFSYTQINITIIFFIIALIPLFISGLLEDLFNNVSPFIRLICGLVSAILIVYLTNTKLGQVDIEWVNEILKISFVSFIFTTIGITATSNAWNIIDGLNGLASGLAIIVLSVICYLAWNENNIEIYNLLIIVIAATFGFFLINFFTGRIFLGDAGSYILGSIVAWSGLVLTSDNSKTSSWVIFFIIIYPATELIISFFRRIKNKKSPFLADNEHLHSILYKIITFKKKNYTKHQINSLTSILILFFASLPSLSVIIYGGKYPEILYSIIIFFFIFLLVKRILTNSLLERINYSNKNNNL